MTNDQPDANKIDQNMTSNQLDTDQIDQREKLFQLYATLVTVFTALQALATNVTYKVNSSNLSNITVSQIPNESSGLLQIAYPSFIFFIIAYYILLKTTSGRKGAIANISGFIASLCFSYMLCNFLGFTNFGWFYFAVILITLIVALSLQTWIIFD